MVGPPALPRRQRVSARWVASPGRPVTPDGIVEIIDHQIAAVGPWDGQPIDYRFDDAILLPGLVNAHTHLDLSGSTEQTPPQRDFGEWLQSVVDFRRASPSESTAESIGQGIRQLIDSGTTLVGDISSSGLSPSLLFGTGVTGVCFRELIGLSEQRCSDAIAMIETGEALSPHAPYSFRFSCLGGLPSGVPLAMHVAESPEEMELLRKHSGPIREFLERLGAWNESGLAPSIDAVVETLSKRIGPTLLVHGNYLRPVLDLPPNVSVAFCPRTHATFGHDPHPFRQWLGRGIRVVLGTDSLASNPDLSILNEARFLFRQFPDPDALLRMITIDGARSLGFHDRGRIEPGSRADFCLVQVAKSTANPLGDLFGGDGRVIGTWAGGQRIT